MNNSMNASSCSSSISLGNGSEFLHTSNISLNMLFIDSADIPSWWMDLFMVLYRNASIYIILSIPSSPSVFSNLSTSILNLAFFYHLVIYFLTSRGNGEVREGKGREGKGREGGYSSSKWNIME